MKILLVHPCIEAGKITPFFPLGLGYVASVLLAAGHEVNVLDINEHYDWPWTAVAEEIKKAEYDVMGITGKISDFFSIQQLARISKQYNHQANVLVGGALASAAPQVILEGTEADIVIKGEGEHAVIDLLKTLESGHDLNSVQGIFYKKDSLIISTASAENPVDLEKNLFPAWHLFSMKFYTQITKYPFSRIAHMSMITSRGCPYKCVFCSHTVFGHKFRPRPVNSIVEEMWELRKKFKVKGINFEDDTFTLDKNRVHSLCDKLIRQRMKMVWTCTGRTDSIDKDLLKHMKQAGCVAMSLGVESGSQLIIDEIEKGTTVEKNRIAMKIAWDVGIVVKPFMLIGMPSETKKTLEQSIEFCKDVGSTPEFSIVTPLPATDLWNRASLMGKVKSEQQLVEAWGHWFNGVLVNMSAMSDEELIEAKKQAERELFNYNLLHHWKHHLIIIMMFIKVNGAADILFRAKNFLRRIFSFNKIKKRENQNVCFK
ncbi:MAG: radical SAM protein [bacterium]